MYAVTCLGSHNLGLIAVHTSSPTKDLYEMKVTNFN